MDRKARADKREGRHCGVVVAVCREPCLVLDEARAVDVGVGQAQLELAAALEPLRRPLRGADVIGVGNVGRVPAVSREGETRTDALRHGPRIATRQT